jgi:hypothetical protein
MTEWITIIILICGFVGLALVVRWVGDKVERAHGMRRYEEQLEKEISRPRR